MSIKRRRWGVPQGTHGIYKITNRHNGKCYVGSAVNVANRWSKHAMDLNAGNSGCKRLQAAWKHYGEDAFEFSLLESVPSRDMLVAREQHYLDEIKPEYNICKKAYSALGCRHTEESKRKMSLSRRGELNVNYGIRGEDCPAYGRKHTVWARAHLSLQRYGDKNPMYGVTPDHAKLSHDEVRDIKRMLASGSEPKDIKSKYPHLTSLNISQIKHGRAYRRISA